MVQRSTWRPHAGLGLLCPLASWGSTGEPAQAVRSALITVAVGTLGGAPLASGAYVAPVSAQVAAALRRGGGGAGRVPPYSSGKAPLPSQPHTPAQGGRARFGPARRRHAGD